MLLNKNKSKIILFLIIYINNLILFGQENKKEIYVYSLSRIGNHYIYYTEQQMRDLADRRFANDSLIVVKSEILLDSIIKMSNKIEKQNALLHDMDIRLLVDCKVCERYNFFYMNSRNEIVIANNDSYHYAKLANDSCIIKLFRKLIPPVHFWYAATTADFENDKKVAILQDRAIEELEKRIIRIQKLYTKYSVNKKDQRKIDKLINTRSIPDNSLEQFIINYQNR